MEDIARAVHIKDRRGVVAVFLTRWLFSPLGPWVNLTVGSTGYQWPCFTVAGFAGEAVGAGL